MKTNRIFSLIPVLGLLFLVSCEDTPWGCIDGNNRIVTEQRDVGSFSGVISYSSFVINVETGEEYSLSIETDENLLDYIDTYIQGDNLIIETRRDKCIRSDEPILVNVVTKELSKLKLAGSGVMNANNFSAPELDIDLSGSGKIECKNINISHLYASLPGSGIIELSGNAATAEFTLSGSGLIKALELATDKCYASIPGSGNIYTYVNDYLEVSISGSGNLYYKGSPEIKSGISGSGNVRSY